MTAHIRTLMQRGVALPMAVAPSPPSVKPGAWLTIQEFAPRRGKSVETIRLAIHAGVLEAKKVKSPGGTQWLIWDGTARPPVRTNGPVVCPRCHHEKKPGALCQECARRTRRRGRG